MKTVSSYRIASFEFLVEKRRSERIIVDSRLHARATQIRAGQFYNSGGIKTSLQTGLKNCYVS